MIPWFPKVSEPHERRPFYLSLPGRISNLLGCKAEGSPRWPTGRKNPPPWRGQENSFSLRAAAGRFRDFLSDQRQCLPHLSKAAAEHISAPFSASPQLQEVQSTSGLMGATTVAKARAETGTSPLLLTTFCSQIHCSWESTNRARKRSKDLGVADVRTGPGSSTHTDIPPGCWGKVTWEKAFLLVREGTAAATEVPGSQLLLLMWTQTSPSASYFSAVRLPILLPSSSFPWQHFRLRPKHAVRDTRNQLWPYLPQITVQSQCPSSHGAQQMLPREP